MNMSLNMTLLKLGENAKGFMGGISGSMMNLGHKSIYIWGIKNLRINPDSIILDVGCGGGKTIKIYLRCYIKV